jgi:hypothetical protein
MFQPASRQQKKCDASLDNGGLRWFLPRGIRPTDLGLKLKLIFDSPIDFVSGYYTDRSRKSAYSHVYIEIPRASAVIP